MSPPKNLLPYVALGFGVLVLGFSAIFVGWANVPGPVMAFHRLGIATLLLTPVYLFRRRNGEHLPWRWELLIFPALGGFMTAMDHTFWSSAMQYTSAANATLLNYAAPIWVALFAWLVHKENLPLMFWAGLALTLAGMVIVFSSDFFQHPAVGRGDLLAIISSFFYAGYFIATESGRKRLDTLSYIWMVGVCSTLTLAIVNLSLGLPFSGYPVQAYLAFIGAALFSQIGGYLAIGFALGHLPASVVSPTMIGQPVLTALLALPLLGQKLYPLQIIGGLIVLVGVFWVHRGRSSAR